MSALFRSKWRQDLRRVAAAGLVTGSLTMGAAVAVAEESTRQADAGVYRTWLALQRQVARSEGLIRDLEKQQAELERLQPGRGASPDKAAGWQRESDAERGRLSRLRDDLERLEAQMP